MQTINLKDINQNFVHYPNTFASLEVYTKVGAVTYYTSNLQEINFIKLSTTGYAVAGLQGGMHLAMYYNAYRLEIEELSNTEIVYKIYTELPTL